MNNSTKIALVLFLLSMTTSILAGSMYTELIKAKQANKEANEVLQHIKNENDKIIKNYNEINQLNIQLQNRVNKINSDLEKMKGRGEVVAAKPELVEKMINVSYEEFERGLLCVSGSQSYCQ